MSGKAHRVAARQAELSRRKRRARGRPQVESAQAAPESTTQATTVMEPEAETMPTEPQPQRVPEAPQPARRPRRRVTAEMASSSNFVRAELKHIGLIAALMLAILVALSFVLR